jgi:hypothetical protein
LLARDEWGGVSDMAQLLPAFVKPNDPAISRPIKYRMSLRQDVLGRLSGQASRPSAGGVAQAGATRA